MAIGKKTIAYLFVCALLCALVITMGLTLSAKSNDRGYSFSVNVDTDKLVSYLEKEMMDCPKRVDISSYGIPDTTANASSLQKLIWNGSPLLFHVNGIGIEGSGGIIKYVYFTYYYDAATYKQMYDKCITAAEKMVEDLRGNKAMDDMTKALIIHDRIIVNCEYDLEKGPSGEVSTESQTLYGALVNGSATCQGYTNTYMYLLKLVGIDSYTCQSDKMNHDWNIVIINGKKYHVDVTFDDPVYDVTGRVYHNHFMLSTAAIRKADHNFSDFDSSPSDTTYDNYYWRNSGSEFVVVDNKVYYFDNANEVLKRIGSSEPLLKASDAWTTAEGKYWKGNFTRLATDGINLLYSKSDGIYLYDISKGSVKNIYKPALSGEARSIYGFTYKGGYLIIDRYNRPDFAANTKAKYQLKAAYDTKLPTASLSYTNLTAAYQTVNFRFSDNNGIAGYYWGKDSVPANNRYTATHSNTATGYVSESGTYYLTVLDIAGNLSQSVSVTFFSTRLETDGANIALSQVITPGGGSFVLPTPSRQGYEFIGWSKTYTDSGEYYTEYTPVSDGLLYALWRYTGEQGNDDGYAGYVNRFKDVSDDAWYADAVEYCASRGYINGISSTIFSPASNLTREQFVLILANVAGVKADNYKYVDSKMTDVPVGQWYSGAIAWAVSEGYVKGVSFDRFGLRQNITREQLARLFYVYAEDIGMNVSGRADLTGFSDADRVSDWAYEEVRWAVDCGIISGMAADTLVPRGNATRAQTARMFMIFDTLNKK